MSQPSTLARRSSASHEAMSITAVTTPSSSYADLSRPYPYTSIAREADPGQQQQQQQQHHHHHQQQQHPRLNESPRLSSGGRPEYLPPIYPGPESHHGSYQLQQNLHVPHPLEVSERHPTAPVGHILYAPDQAPKVAPSYHPPSLPPPPPSARPRSPGRYGAHPSDSLPEVPYPYGQARGATPGSQPRQARKIGQRREIAPMENEYRINRLSAPRPGLVVDPDLRMPATTYGAMQPPLSKPPSHQMSAQGSPSSSLPQVQQQQQYRHRDYSMAPKLEVAEPYRRVNPSKGMQISDLITSSEEKYPAAPTAPSSSRPFSISSSRPRVERPAPAASSSSSISSTPFSSSSTSAATAAAVGTISKPLPQFQITVRQQPEAARACGFGERDRRVVDPPPILQLTVADPTVGAEEKAALLRYQYSMVHCMLWNADTDTDDTAMLPVAATPASGAALGGGAATASAAAAAAATSVAASAAATAAAAVADRRPQRRLMGTLVASPFVGRDERGDEGCFFCFPDLSCRTPGRYRLKFALVRIDPTRMRPGSTAPILTTVLSGVFQVFNAKEFPGMRPSTELTKRLKDQGCLISVKKGNERVAGGGGAASGSAAAATAAAAGGGGARHRGESDEDEGGDESRTKRPRR